MKCAAPVKIRAAKPPVACEEQPEAAVFGVQWFSVQAESELKTYKLTDLKLREPGAGSKERAEAGNLRAET
jgi:hypothetical protein